MKLFGYHLRRDGCWKEVPQGNRSGMTMATVRAAAAGRPYTVLRLLFEWPWQKKDPMLKR